MNYKEKAREILPPEKFYGTLWDVKRDKVKVALQEAHDAGREEAHSEIHRLKEALKQFVHSIDENYKEKNIGDLYDAYKLAKSVYEEKR